MPKDNLRDKLDGNELDLSLNNLSIVPVKELAAIPKGTKLDLSCNVLVNLPDNFGTLAHLVKIDLSKNHLTELPESFGSLLNLQHLDLLGNKLTILPMSFHKLTKLKWLDLKDNPLKDDLKRAAGDCLDEAQCKQCAQNVLKYMKAIYSELERRRQEKLKQEREEENLRKASQEAEMDKIRQERKNKKKKNGENAKQKPQKPSPVSHKPDNQSVNGTQAAPKVNKKVAQSRGLPWSWILMSLFVLLAGVVSTGSYFYCEQNKSQEICSHYISLAADHSWKRYEYARDTVLDAYKKLNEMVNTEDTATTSKSQNTDPPISESAKEKRPETQSPGKEQKNTDPPSQKVPKKRGLKHRVLAKNRKIWIPPSQKVPKKRGLKHRVLAKNRKIRIPPSQKVPKKRGLKHRVLAKNRKIRIPPSQKVPKKRGLKHRVLAKNRKIRIPPSQRVPKKRGQKRRVLAKNRKIRIPPSQKVPKKRGLKHRNKGQAELRRADKRGHLIGELGQI